MEKLELKHIAPYLPYGLKSADIYVKQYGLTKPLISDVVASNIMKFTDGSSNSKIILRPLSELIKDEKFIKETNENLFCGAWKFELENDCLKIITTEGYVNIIYINEEIAYECSYSTYLYLIENHYDIFGLIDKGLAVSYLDVQSSSNEG
jgi:hypothetical protein